NAERGLLKLDLHVVTQIGATLSIFGASPTAEERLENSATDSASAKDFTENVEWIVKTATGKAGTLRKGRVPEPIVGRVFIRIDEDIVCFAEFLEPFFGMRIVGIFIWMKLDCELAISAFDLLLRGVAPHAQNFVIIAFGRSHFFNRTLRVAQRSPENPASYSPSWFCSLSGKSTITMRDSSTALGTTT